MNTRLYALGLGIVCHTLFLIGAGAMAYMLYGGLSEPIYPIGGTVGIVINLLLVLQFPILHSYFLGKSGASRLSKVHPGSIAADLATTSFAIVAALQLIVTFVFWTPSGTVWFRPHGTTALVWSGIYVSCWALLHKAISDASLAVHSGFLGWWAVARGKRPQYAPFPHEGLFSVCRQPIYLCFFLILLSGPVWTPDHLFIAAVWGSYCIIGPLHKERRFAARYGEAFKRYQLEVPYFLPMPRFVKK